MCWCCCRKKKVVTTESNINPKIVDGSGDLESVRESSLWRALSTKISSWSLPKDSKRDFDASFDEYLALEPSVNNDSSADAEGECDTESVSSTLSELLG